MIGTVSFGALRAFVEVGRQASVKRAAAQLNVTPGAISQQVKALEKRLGVRLLEHSGRDIRLSADGLMLFGGVAANFDAIDETLELFATRRGGPQTLTVSTTSSFASCWLTSRLGRFGAENPAIEIRLEVSEQLADLAADGVDLAIRYGLGAYPGLDARLLVSPRLVVVGSPAFVAASRIEAPADCLRLPLLQDRQRADWPRWFQGLGLKAPRGIVRGPSFADDGLLIRAAAAGQGLAVVRDIAAWDDLAVGRLCLALPDAVETAECYYVVARPDRLRVPKIAAFIDWVLREAEESAEMKISTGASSKTGTHLA
jgi:LysR family transcriptional regulator, glycine cleavage system transcriptional activator